MKNSIAIIALALAFGGANFIHATEIRQSNIDHDVTWGLNGSPYYIYGDLAIVNNATLTVKAGVEVRFVEIHGDGGYEDGAELVVRAGALVTEGSETMPVLFTSANQTRKAGDWGAIVVEYGNQYVLDNAIIEYAKNGLRLYYTTANGTSQSSVDGTVIRHCLDNGVFAYSAHADFFHLTATSNDYAGIKTGAFCNVSVHASDVYNNGMYNFYNGSAANVDAADCWWGTTSPYLIEFRIYDKTDNPAVGEVDYTPYLSGSYRDGGNIPNYSLGLVKSVFR